MMEYNTSQEHLVMREYGRCIQQMVKHALSISDRQERTDCVYTIARTIETLFPKLRDDANYKQKIWDHIAMMADYQLDVDSPYPMPKQQEASMAVTDHLPYPMNSIRRRQYGKYVEDMIIEACKIEDEFSRLQVVAQLAVYMKSVLLQGGKDSNAEDRVCADIYDLSGGKLSYDYAEFESALPRETRPYTRNSYQTQHRRNSYQSQGGRAYGNNYYGYNNNRYNKNKKDNNYGGKPQGGRRYKKY